MGGSTSKRAKSEENSALENVLTDDLEASLITEESPPKKGCCGRKLKAYSKLKTEVGDTVQSVRNSTNEKLDDEKERATFGRLMSLGTSIISFSTVMILRYIACV